MSHFGDFVLLAYTFLKRSQKNFIKAFLGNALNSLLPNFSPIYSSEDEYCFISPSLPKDFLDLVYEHIRSFESSSIRKIVRTTENCIQWAKHYKLSGLQRYFEGINSQFMYGIEIGDWCEFFLNDFNFETVCLKSLVLILENKFSENVDYYSIKFLFAKDQSFVGKLEKNKNLYLKSLKKADPLLRICFNKDQTICLPNGSFIVENILRQLSKKLRSIGFKKIEISNLFSDIKKLDFADKVFNISLKNSCFPSLFINLFAEYDEDIKNHISSVFGFFDYLFSLLGLKNFVIIKNSNKSKVGFLIDLAIYFFGPENVFFDDDLSCFETNLDFFVLDKFDNPYKLSCGFVSKQKKSGLSHISFSIFDNMADILSCLFVTFDVLPLSVCSEHVRIVVADKEHYESAMHIFSEWIKIGLFVGIDDDFERSISFRIKNCIQQKVPYVAVYGKKDCIEAIRVKDVVSGIDKTFTCKEFAEFVMSKCF